MKNICYLFLLFPLALNAQLLNGNFETWADSLQEAPYEAEAIQFGADNPLMATPDHWTEPSIGINRVENSFEGDYALLLYTWYNYVAAGIEQTIDIDTNPSKLTGYYQYHLVGADYEEAIRYARIAALSDQGDTLGFGEYIFDTTSTYTYFEVPIIFNSEEPVQQLKVQFFTNGIGSAAIINGLIFLDELKLQNAPLSTSHSALEADVNIFPNPTKDQVIIQQRVDMHFHTYTILNSTGQMILRGKLSGENTLIPLSRLAKGIYSIRLETKEGWSVHKKLIKE